MRTLIAAREQLLDAEASFLDLLIAHPTAWAQDKAADGSLVLRFSDAGVLAQARALATKRDAAGAAIAAALKQ
jgi:hypothetical protein